MAGELCQSARFTRLHQSFAGRLFPCSQSRGYLGRFTEQENADNPESLPAAASDVFTYVYSGEVSEVSDNHGMSAVGLRSVSGV